MFNFKLYQTKYSMSKMIWLFIFLLPITVCFGQTVDTAFFMDKSLKKEVSKAKAKYSKIVTKNADSTITTVINDLLKNEVISSETFKGNEPFGIWINQLSMPVSTIDYNFPLVYKNQLHCKDSITDLVKNVFKDDDSLGYKAPRFESYDELYVYRYIARKTLYLKQAFEKEIQGTVYISFSITRDGSVSDVVVYKGVDVLLDKEAARVLRELKFTSPAMLKGQAIDMPCLTLPIKFIQN